MKQGMARALGVLSPHLWLGARPEVAHLPPDQREEVVRAAVRRHQRSWVVSASYLCIVLSQLKLILPAVAVLRPGIPFPNLGFWEAQVVVLLTLLAPGVPWVMWMRRRLRRALQAELLGRGLWPSRCLDCGYDLTGNASGTCPECGTPVRGAT